MESGSREQGARDGREVVVGLLAAKGLTFDLAEELGRVLPGMLDVRYPEADWRVVVRSEPLAGPAGVSEDLVQIARRRMLSEGWTLVICLTDLPLHVGPRPVTAFASSALGVGVVSVPSLGPFDLESRVRQAVLRLIRGLLGENMADRKAGRKRGRSRIRGRLRELASPVGRTDVADEHTVRFVTATGRGNLRLLAGMVRANRPWRLVVGLSRVLVAALGTVALALSSPGIWLLADGMGPPRQATMTLGSIAVTCALLITVHRLWERMPSWAVRREERERIVLFNLATTTTVVLGIATLYVALFVASAVCGWVLVAPRVLTSETGDRVGAGDYLWLALLVTALATIGSGLGAAVERGRAVREAAYGYRPDQGVEELEDESGDADRGGAGDVSADRGRPDHGRAEREGR